MRNGLTPPPVAGNIFGTSGRNSVVECQLPKLDVEGSNPFARSNLHFGFAALFAHFPPFLAADGEPAACQCHVRSDESWNGLQFHA